MPVPSGPVAAIHSAEVLCDVCGHETPHRVLRATRDRDGTVRGTARCQECRFTHPFTARAAKPVSVSAVVSEGPTSVRMVLPLAPDLRVGVGDLLTPSDEPLEIRRIETHHRRDVRWARAHDVATLWLVPRGHARVPISIVEGRRTRSEALVVLPATVLGVGTNLEVGDALLEVVALRARGVTWRRPGDEFPASDVQRLYARRTVMPPAGSRDWSRSRESPRSRESSTSRTGRSRSSPGVNTHRTSPREARAERGATVQRSTPS